MKKIWSWIKNNPNRAMFLVPILLVAGISISHVVTWYDIANPISWAIYLSIAIEVGAMTALVAATNRIKGGVWFMFGIVTLIQMIGNIFFSYKEIDANGDLFKSWVELTAPMWEMIGSDPADIPSMKRWLAFLEGGLLPIISLTSLHFFVKYDTNNSPKIESESPKTEPKGPEPKKKRITDSPNEIISDERIEELSNLQKEADKAWAKVKELKEEGKLPPEPTEEELADEPTALAFTSYLVEEDDMSDLDNTLMDGLDDLDPIELTEADSKIFAENVTDELQSPNELLENALKKYKESKGTAVPPLKNKRSDIKRID